MASLAEASILRDCLRRVEVMECDLRALERALLAACAGIDRVCEQSEKMLQRLDTQGRLLASLQRPVVQ